MKARGPLRWNHVRQRWPLVTPRASAYKQGPPQVSTPTLLNLNDDENDEEHVSAATGACVSLCVSVAYTPYGFTMHYRQDCSDFLLQAAATQQVVCAARNQRCEFRS